MKTFISIIAGALVFCLGFWLDSQLINLIVSNFQNPHSDLATVVKIALWVVTFGITFSLSILCGIVVGSLIKSILD